jgi:hypothetical protein
LQNQNEAAVASAAACYFDIPFAALVAVALAVAALVAAALAAADIAASYPAETA